MPIDVYILIQVHIDRDIFSYIRYRARDLLGLRPLRYQHRAYSFVHSRADVIRLRMWSCPPKQHVRAAWPSPSES